jgi:hypothetical protein
LPYPVQPSGKGRPAVNQIAEIYLRQKQYCKRGPDLLGFSTMKHGSRRILALLLLFVNITGLVVSFSENVLCAGEPPGAHQHMGSSPTHDSVQTHDSTCPGAPSPSSHSPSDHFCTGDCGCPCQAPLSPSLIVISYSPLFDILRHADPVRYIPEVYLSLFVPPDSATV